MSDYKRHILKRIASLVSENSDLKEKNKALEKSFHNAQEELLQCKEWLHKIEKLNNDKNQGDSIRNEKKRFDTVTILYIHIQGFSNIVSPDSDLTGQMDKLDNIILQFKEIAKKYHLVRLRTIGDQFICAGGMPEKDIANPIEITLAALEMLSIVESETNDEQVWSIQVGIHTGSVVAQVGGRTSSSYEVTGDTLNIASRIGSIGVKNTVIVSAISYEFVKELFDCHYLSLLPVKYQNKIELFAVDGIKPELALDSKRRLSNNVFRTRLMLIRFNDLQELILDKLEKELPKHLYYHNVKHTVDVVTECELIGWAEGVKDHPLLLLKTAALFHDTGHIVSYADHEDHSTDIAREILPAYHYSPDEIDEVCRIIMATKLPPKPSDLLESIICDSDLDYLGRTDFIPVSNSLYEELSAQNRMTDLNAWNKQQLKFISSHQYFTKTARELREVKKQEQIERIKQLIED